MANQQLDGKDIIDATQNVVINAAENVSEIIQTTSAEVHGHGYGAFYENPQFWVAISFVLVIVFLARPVGKLIHSMLSKRIDNITHRIHEAANLQDDAQKMLAEYEKKFKNAQAEADAILAKSKKEIEFLKKENISKLEKDMKSKEKDAKERLEGAKIKASQEIANIASDLTIKSLKATLASKLDDKAKDKLINDSISLVAKLK